MRTILLLFAALVVNIIHAQNFEWAKNIPSGSGNSITTDATGNVYVVGGFFGTSDFDPGVGVFNLTSAGEKDIFIIKLSASGNLLWTKQIGGAGDDAGNSIVIDQLGNILVTGYFSQNVDFDPGAGTSFLQAAPLAYLVPAGVPPPPSPTNTRSDIFILKLNSSGNFIWAKGMGGSGYDYGSTISTDGSGNIYAAGSHSDTRYFFRDTVDFDPGPGVYNLTGGGNFLLKLSSTGDFVWASNFGQIGSVLAIFSPVSGIGLIVSKESSFYINAIVNDQAGNVFATGQFYLSADFDPGPGTYTLNAVNRYDMFVAKFSSSGNLSWAKMMNGNEEGLSFSRDIAVDASGNVYTSGYFNGKVDFDPGPGNYNFETSHQNQNVTLFIGPNNFDLVYGTSDIDIFVSKLDASGNFVWAKQMGGNSDDRSYSIALDDDNNVYTTGFFSDKCDFDPGQDKFKLKASGTGSSPFPDAFISKVDASGNLVWAGQLGGAGDEGGKQIILKGTNIYTTGYFEAQCDFDPSDNIFDLTSNGSRNIFIHKLNQSNLVTKRSINPNELNTDAVKEGMKLFPNPTNGPTTITTKNGLDNATIKVFSASGQLVMEKSSVSGTSYSINIAGLSKGFYSVEINNNGAVSRLKLIKN